jgi:hypothetical protein
MQRLQGLESSHLALYFRQVEQAMATLFPDAILFAVRMALPKDLLVFRAIIGVVEILFGGVFLFGGEFIFLAGLIIQIR